MALWSRAAARDPRDRIEEEIESSLFDLPRIQLFHGAGGRVARVHEKLERLFAVQPTFVVDLLPFFVELAERRTGEVDLAPHLQQTGNAAARARRRGGQGQRKRANRPGVAGHIVADPAITSGDGTDQGTVLVSDGGRRSWVPPRRKG